MSVEKVYEALDKKFPYECALDYDNSGVIVSFPEEIKKAIVTLDITANVIKEAVKEKANLIVSHHPLTLSKISSVCSETSAGKLLISLIKNNISAISVHTNLDVAQNGLNDILADKLHISKAKIFNYSTGIPLGRVGQCSVKKLNELYDLIKTELNINTLKVVESNTEVSNVAVIGGSGAGYLSDAKNAGANTLITSDCKHNSYLEASALEMNLIDAGHFNTEAVVLDMLAEMLNKEVPEIVFMKSKTSKDIIKFI